MSLEEILAKAKEAAAFKQETEQKQSVDAEIKSYEQSQEMLTAKQARLEEISQRKGMDEKKLAEIRKVLATSSGFAKGKKDITKVMSEAGMSEEEIQPLIDEARAEQKTIVDDKLDKRSQRRELKDGLEQLSAEEQQVGQDISEMSRVELSEAAQNEKNFSDLAESVIALKEIQNLSAVIPKFVDEVRLNMKSGENLFSAGKFKTFVEQLNKHPESANQLKIELLKAPIVTTDSNARLQGKDFLDFKVYPPEVLAQDREDRLDPSEAISVGDMIGQIEARGPGVTEDEVKSRIDGLVSQIAPDKKSDFQGVIRGASSFDNKEDVMKKLKSVME